MKDKIIRIKRSRLKPWEIDFLNMLDGSNERLGRVVIHWEKNGNEFLSYDKLNKTFNFSRELVFMTLLNKYQSDVVISEFIKSFCSVYFNIEIIKCKTATYERKINKN